MRPAGTVGWRGIQSQVGTDRNTVLWEKPASQPSIPGCLALVSVRELPETLRPGGKNKAENDPFFSWN